MSQHKAAGWPQGEFMPDYIAPRPSRAEMERRWQLVRAFLRQNGIDALVALGTGGDLSGALGWLTDRPIAYRSAVIVYPDDLMTLICHGPAGEELAHDGNDSHAPGVGRMAFVAEFPSVHFTQTHEAELVADELTHRGARSVAIYAPDAMPFGFIGLLQNKLGNASLIDATEVIDHFKAIKSAEEQAILRQVAIMHDEMFTAALSCLRPGILEADAVSLIEREGRLRGGHSGIVMAGSAPAGRKAMMKPSRAQNRIMAEGDQITLLIENAGNSGYYLELGRPLVLGRANAALLEGFAAAVEAQKFALSLCKPGASCSDIAMVFNDYLQQLGHAPEKRIFAHSQGLDLVERPLIRHDETMRLEEGMCLAVHPAIETPDLFALVCDNYLIGPDGPLPCLHKTEQRVFEIGV